MLPTYIGIEWTSAFQKRDGDIARNHWTHGKTKSPQRSSKSCSSVSNVERFWWLCPSIFAAGKTLLSLGLDPLPACSSRGLESITVKQRNDRIRSQELTSQFAGRRQPELLREWHESLKTLKPTLGDTTPPARPHLPKAVVPPRDQVFNPLRQWNHSYSNEHTFRLYFP